jgi:hypothetical protein
MTRRHRHDPGSDIDWSTIDYVVGTRTDVTRTGINRPCSRCGEPVFTSRRYPAHVSMICEYCALIMVEEEQAAEEAASPTTAKPESVTGLEPLLDPWQRASGIRRRSATTSGRRRLRAAPSGPSPLPKD